MQAAGRVDACVHLLTKRSAYLVTAQCALLSYVSCQSRSKHVSSYHGSQPVMLQMHHAVPSHASNCVRWFDNAAVAALDALMCACNTPMSLLVIFICHAVHLCSAVVQKLTHDQRRCLCKRVERTGHIT
jgi:hypothetical protein